MKPVTKRGKVRISLRPPAAVLLRRTGRLLIFKPALVLIVAGVALIPRPGFSQDTGTATNTVTRLPSVTVTAQKEPQPAQSLPVSVTAVTQLTLQEENIQEVKPAAIYAPNTFINEFTARAVSNPFFRGIGGSPLNPGVTTFIDGVPQLDSYSSSIELSDVDQVEFVRGPQGALFGRNTAGGLINITSRRPSDIWTGGAAASYGNYDLRDVRGGISGPVATNKLALSVAGGYSARDGYTVNDFTGHDLDSREAEFGKAQLLFKANERLELRLIVSGEHDHDGDYALGDLNAIRLDPHHVDRDFEGYNRRDVVSATLLGNYHGDTVDVASISGFVWWKNRGLTDLDYTPLPGNTHDNDEQQHQLTQEFRLSSPADRPLKLNDVLDLGWQSGVFLFYQSYRQNVLDVLSPPLSQAPFAIDSTSTADLDNWGVGVYGQAKLTAWEKLDFNAGLRFDYEDKRATLGSFTSPPVTPSGTQPFNDNFSEASPQFSVDWRFSSNQMVYASVARGYKAGGFNQTAPTGNEAYGSEHSWNYEMGQKSKWFDERLETTLALFYIDWRSLQLNVPFGGPQEFYISNIGGAASKGVEFEAKYRPCSHLDLFGSFGYADAKFLSGTTDNGVSVGGNRLPYTPAATGNVGGEATWAPCRAATLYARAEVTVYGDFKYDSANAQGQSTYSLANFRAGVRGDNWFVEGWADNAFDTHYVPIAIPYSQALAPSGYIGESGAPVTFGVRAGLHF